MARDAYRCKTYQSAGAKGFTLVEMVVVLVILSILAAAGVGSAIGYLKKSKFTENEKNAETIYQAVQTALQQKEKNGSIDSWITDNVLNNGTVLTYVASNSSNSDLEKEFLDKDTFLNPESDTDLNKELKPNMSLHARYVLTYNPKVTGEGSQSKVLRDLIQPYFYDAVIFAGTISVELDIEKAYDAHNQIHYSARCLSVFFNSRCDSGWDTDALHGFETVPDRNYEHRRTKSLVGYYNGYSGASIDTVYLPAIEDGLDVKLLEYDPATGELSWSATLEGKALTGTGKHVYYQIDVYTGETKTTTLYINEDFLIKELPIDSNTKGLDLLTELASKSDGDKLQIGTVKWDVSATEESIVYVNGSGGSQDSVIYRKSITVDAGVFEGTGNYSGMSSSAVLKSMPLKITYIDGEYEVDGTTKKAPYVVYSLDISGYAATNNNIAFRVCPNDFSLDEMKSFNDKSGIVPMNKSIKVGVSYTAPAGDNTDGND